jgi:hypothetical protein
MEVESEVFGTVVQVREGRYIRHSHGCLHAVAQNQL